MSGAGPGRAGEASRPEGETHGGLCVAKRLRQVVACCRCSDTDRRHILANALNWRNDATVDYICTAYLIYTDYYRTVGCLPADRLQTLAMCSPGRCASATTVGCCVLAAVILSVKGTAEVCNPDVAYSFGRFRSTSKVEIRWKLKYEELPTKHCKRF